MNPIIKQLAERAGTQAVCPCCRFVLCSDAVLARDQPARHMTEPYAWVDGNSRLQTRQTDIGDIPLYTKTEWQGLTKLHAKLIAENSPNIEWAIMLTEQALKEKNGG